MAESFQETVLRILDSMDKRMIVMETKITTMGNLLTANTPNFKKAGATFEILVRKHLKDLKGGDYARSFRVANLSGLARLALPKNFGFDFENQITQNADEFSYKINDDRVKILAFESLKNIDNLRVILATKTDGSYKFTSLVKELAEFDMLEGEVNKLEYLRSSRLGFWAFSCKAFNNGNFILYLILI